MSSLCINMLVAGGIITNYHCVSRCGHCLYNCGPNRSRDYLEPVLVEAIFARVAALGCRSVHIGGGEPLLEPKKLIAVLGAAHQAGIGIEYVDPDQPARRTFLHHCDLCTDIRRHLRQADGQRFPELAPGGFYQEWSPV